jgi:hypothetical protein
VRHGVALDGTGDGNLGSDAALRTSSPGGPFPDSMASDLSLRSSTRPGHLFIRLDRPTRDCPLFGLRALDTTE